METNEEIDVLDQEEEINIYDDICNFDLGEEIERLKAENKKLEEHICSLKADIDRLNGTIAELKVTQNNLTKNISSLFMTAKTEIERKNRMIEELREKVENRGLRSFKPDFKKRKDRENSPSEANKSKRYKYDESTTRCEVQGVPYNDKLEPEPDERQELQSKYSNRQRPVDDSRYQQRFKYPYNKYSNQFENNKYDSKLRYSNETYTESNKFEFKNKHYNDRYNNYEDDGYHSRSTYSYDRYRNEMEERYDSRSQYCNDSYNNWTNNRIDGDGTYDNRDYYNRSSRSNVEDRDGGQERFDTYADNRRNDQCDSSYYRNERNRSFERPGRSRSGTPFTPFASDVREDTSQNIERDASNVAVNSETNPERERSLTPMPLPEDIDEPNPKPPKKRLKMLEDMEKKVRQNRLSQTTRLSDQCATNKPSDINKHNHAWSYDIDRNSVTSSKSTKSSKSDRESQGSAQRKEANLVKEKVSVKNKTGSSKEKFSPRNYDIHPKKDIKQSPKKETTNIKRKIDNTVEHHMKERISKLFCSPLKLNNEKCKMTNECVSKEPKQKCSKISNAETEQKSNVKESSVKRVEKDVQRTTNNEQHMKEMISKLFHSPLKLNDEIPKMTNECVSKEPKQKCLKISNAETEQKSIVQESSVKRVEKDVQMTANNGSQKHTQKEIRSSTKNSPETLSVHRNQPEDKILKKPSQIVKISPGNNLSNKRDKKREDKIEETKNQENTDIAKDFENVGKPSENVNKSTKAATNEEILQKRRNTPHSFEESCNSEKPSEDGKENIRKQSVDKDLNMDKVDGQGKTEEKVVAKAVMPEELKTTEESIKYSQRHNIRSFKERVVASKDGTTESEQKDKNVEEGKENIGKQSVDKGLNMDNVDGQGKMEEKVVAKVAMHIELKTTEESEKYSQRHSTRSSKERVDASKDGTTESEQKDKNVEEGKENIRKKSVDKGLNKDNVDGQGKTEEKVVAKAVMPKELKTTEESVKYSQRHSIRSSKERVAASKDGTIDSEQKDKNVEEGKATIRKQSVDKELNMDNVDGQGKTEEKVVANAVMPKELKTTEESVKYSQRHSIRSSKETVAASKDGTTESEQKDKNVGEGKENIRKQSVDKGLHKDNGDGQGKIEEKVIVKVAMKTTEESVKHSIQSSREKVVAFKEGTTESEQKDKNAEETTRRNNKKVEKQDVKDTDKEQKQKE
ncbi:transcriptional regulator ATRX-like, partial [Anoplophora glabripennis]|uniref:transcriptional regulator ATRX-like n=1 Tax=Anoplophora glabripennis TaxID=217634 RepID=UPI000C768309